MTAPRPSRTDGTPLIQSELARFAPPAGDRFLGRRITPLTRRRLDGFRAQPARLLVVVDLSRAVSGHACSPSSSPTTGRSLVRYDGAWYFPVFADYPETTFGGEFPTAGRLPRPGGREADRGEGLDGLAADPVQLRHDQLRPAEPRAVAAVARQLARHRRPGPRCAGAADLRLSHLGAVRPHPDRALLGDRRRRRGGAGLFRRPRRSRLPALHRDLVGAAGPLSADHHGELYRAEFLVAAWV